MTTSAFVSFGLFSAAIKQDATATVNVTLQPFSKLADLKTGNISAKPYATYEPNFWLLDGNYKFRLADPLVHVGLFSVEQSDENGIFATPPVLTVTFASVHSTQGLTLKFSQTTNDYASIFSVAYYNAANALIQTNTYYPTTPEFYTAQAATDFTKIVITFYNTNKAVRFLRLRGLDYGKLINFSGADIKTCSIIEEIDPTALTLPINTLDLTVFSSDADFNIVDPLGDYASLQRRQPLDVYENVEGERVFIGTFYLDDWENLSDTLIHLKAVDLIGVMDAIPCRGGMYQAQGILVKDVLETLLSAANIPYELDPYWLAYGMIGWIPNGSLRDAVQQIAFSLTDGYDTTTVVTCARASSLQILAVAQANSLSEQKYHLTKAEMGSTSLTLKTLVTGVEVTSHEFQLLTTVVEIYKGELVTGTHTIIFNAPMHDLTITGATITASGANFAEVSVSATGIVTLSGQEYSDAQTIVGKYAAADPNIKANILKITNATLIAANHAQAMADIVYSYYAQRYLQKMKLFVPEAAVVDSVLIDVMNNRQLVGLIEKMSFDLAGGFVATTEVYGVVIQ